MVGLLTEEPLTKGRMRGLLSGVSSFFNLRSVLPTANVPAHRSAGQHAGARILDEVEWGVLLGCVTPLFCRLPLGSETPRIGNRLAAGHLSDVEGNELGGAASQLSTRVANRCEECNGVQIVQWE